MMYIHTREHFVSCTCSGVGVRSAAAAPHKRGKSRAGKGRKNREQRSHRRRRRVNTMRVLFLIGYNIYYRYNNLPYNTLQLTVHNILVSSSPRRGRRFMENSRFIIACM